MSDFFEDNSKEKKNIQSLMQSWSKKDIERLADNSRKKLERIADNDYFEENLKHQVKTKEKERENLRKSKSKKRKKISSDNDDTSLYAAKVALNKKKTIRKRREGIIRRIIRFFRGLKQVRKELADRPYVTDEQELKLYSKVLWDAFGPLCFAVTNAADTFWEFVRKLWEDGCDLVLALVDLIVHIYFFLSKVFDWVEDKVWDFIFILDQNKRKLFFAFSSAISVFAMILIVISSVSAYEYSYYGKKLGVAKSKQEIYRTIEVLGDKLSDVTGANISLNVGRDIKFTRVFGFKLAVDSQDEILNNLTYMKDLQALGFAIKIDGKTAVILENEETAKKVIEEYKNIFAAEKDGVEYSVKSFQQTVTFDEEQILLGDIWNQKDALEYLQKGFLGEPEEGQDAKPMIDVYSIETATYDVSIPFDKEYIENSSIYTDEITLISKGVEGKETVIAKVVRLNGEELERDIISSTRVSNPINAMYYQGTKPIPPTSGTGTFIFPLDSTSNWYQTSYFGEAYGVAGVNPIHQANDYGVDIGAHVYASDGGRVEFAGYQPGYGFMVQIDHGGLYQTIYAHLDEVFVQSGEMVYQGQHIANSGNTGISTGPHLHFEVRYKGYPIDPDIVLYYR